MRVIDYVKRLLGRGPVPPLLVRARIGKEPVDELVVHATWAPMVLRTSYQAKDSQGLCALPWVSGAERVELLVCSGHRVKRLCVQVRSAREGRVIEVRLDG